ncbi:MAG: hypothetical protein LAO77_23630, partial [Acidobacteriia bacterium]|nr:hypothetical protein [Terriglobia bacterium]
MLRAVPGRARRELAPPPLTRRPGNGRAAGGRAAGQRRLLRVRQRIHAPRRFVDVVLPQFLEQIETRIEEFVVVDVAARAHDPSAIEHAELLHGIPADDAVQARRLEVRLGEHALLQLEQRAAEHDREEQQRDRRAIEADAAGAHDDQLAVLRQQPDRHQRRQQRGQRDDVVHELRRREVEVPHEHARRRRAAEQLVGQIDERRDVEDPDERDEHQHEDAQVLLG